MLAVYSSMCTITNLLLNATTVTKTITDIATTIATFLPLRAY